MPTTKSDPGGTDDNFEATPQAPADGPDVATPELEVTTVAASSDSPESGGARPPSERCIRTTVPA